ncbi:MAG: GNAT family N-acetyltransferase [Phenylobacterium sp.]|uniref:GNAT family N-acetyltransferase n=1 Tax=Phenylobacterium sp. TaxID=1871053 RepID=UPI0039198B9E
MEYEVVRPQDLSPARIARWGELQAQDILFDSPYLSPEWARAVARAQRPSDAVRVVVASRGGRDVAFLAAKVGAYTAMPAGAPMCDYQGLVAEPGAGVSARELVQALGVHRFDFAHWLEGVGPFDAYARGRMVSHVVDVSGGYAAYEAERKAAGVGLLKDCEKKRRKAEREHGEVKFTAYSRSEAAFEQLIAWKRAQYRATGQTDIFAAEWTGRLLRDLFASRDPEFGGALFTLHLGDRLAAVHLHLRGRHTIHGWIIAHDPAFEKLSPGLLLFQSILKWMDETPYRRLDLGPGDYRFKRELANARQGMSHGFVGLPSPATLVRGAAYGVRAAAEALPLGRVSELPGKAMRRMDRWRALR